MRADAATLFSAFVDFGERKIFAAFEATRFEVRSFLAIWATINVLQRFDLVKNLSVC